MPFTISRPKVILENFDDETILINLDSGMYYSLNKAGSEILSLAERCTTLAEVVEALSRRYAGETEDIRAGVEHVVSQLRQEALIVPRSVPPVVDRESVASSDGVESQKSPFIAPVLTAFGDMQEILQLDPIHDVDASGWPTVRKA
jgi:hypothetical protein